MEETVSTAPTINDTVPILGFVSGVDYEAQKKAEADALAARIAGEKVKPNLLSYLQQCLDDAVNAKQQSGITDQLLEAQRRRKGIHSAEKLAQLKKYKLPNYWVPITQTKCIHTESWMRDILMPYADKIWKAEPSPIPDLQADEKEQVLATVMEEAKEFMLNGGMVSDQQIQNVREKVAESVQRANLAVAKNRASNMERLIQDQHEECAFRDVFREFQSNLTTYGTAFLKGPFTAVKKAPKWDGTRRIVIDKVIPACSSPSPHDIFPAPWVKDENEGWIIERIKTYREGLSSVRKQPYYQTKEIESLLTEYQGSTSLQNQPGDQQRDEQENKANVATDNRIECWQYSGPIAGYMLADWGLENISAADDYNVEVLWGRNHILKVVPMWDEVGTKSYFRAIFKKIPGSFWGIGVPLLMSASQDRANMMMIQLLDGVSWGAGFIGWINQMKLVNQDDVKEMHSKKWIATKMSTNPGDNGPPMGIIDINLKVAELNALYQQCLSDADNESGVPAYMYGSGAAGPASGTFSGLSTLMNAAARGIKDALLAIDDALSRFIAHWADWNNEYSDDESVKGDIRVVCTGATGLFVQEMQLQKLDELAIQAKDMIPIIGPRFNVDILRQKARLLKANESLIPTDEEIRIKIENTGKETTPIKPSMNISVKMELLPQEVQVALMNELGIQNFQSNPEPTISIEGSLPQEQPQVNPVDVIGGARPSPPIRQ
jgi:hypothetical protein